MHFSKFKTLLRFGKVLMEDKYANLFYNCAEDRGYIKENDNKYYVNVDEENSDVVVYSTDIIIDIEGLPKITERSAMMIVNLSIRYRNIKINIDHRNKIVSDIQDYLWSFLGSLNILIKHISLDIIIYLGSGLIDEKYSIDIKDTLLKRITTSTKRKYFILNNIYIQIYSSETSTPINPMRHIYTPEVLYLGSLIRWSGNKIYLPNYARMLRLQRRYKTNLTKMFDLLKSYFRDYSLSSLEEPFNEEIHQLNEMNGSYINSYDSVNRLDINYFIAYLKRYNRPVELREGTGVTESININIQKLRTVDAHFPDILPHPLRVIKVKDPLAMYLGLYHGDIIMIYNDPPINTVNIGIVQLYIIIE